MRTSNWSVSVLMTMSDLERWTMGHILSVDITNYTCVVWLRTTTFDKMTHVERPFIRGQSCQHLKSRAQHSLNFLGHPTYAHMVQSTVTKFVLVIQVGEERFYEFSIPNFWYSPAYAHKVWHSRPNSVPSHMWRKPVSRGEKSGGCRPEHLKSLCDRLHVHTAWEIATKFCIVK